MGGVISGFVVIGVVVLVGYFLGRAQVLGASGREVLSLLTFNVASPALLFKLMSESKLSQLLSPSLAAMVISTVVCAGVFAVVGAIRHWGVGQTTIGALCSSYVNSGNLGIPIAVYVLGDSSLVAPVMLFQLVLYTPVALTIIDLSLPTSGRTSVWKLVGTPLRNPIVLGALAGVAVSLSGWTVWAPIHDAVVLVAGMAVPAMLLAYGISLHGTSAPGRGEDSAQVWLSVGLKTVLQPAVAWLVGVTMFHFEPEMLLGVVVIAALPGAQNLFTYAWRYNTGTVLARESILLSTMFAPLALTVIAALLG